MKEVKASIWDSEFDSFWRVIPINCQIDSKNRLIMGAGLAKEAAKRYDNLAVYWGVKMQDNRRKEALIRGLAGTPKTAEHLFVGLLFYDSESLIGFPTKYHWKDKSNLRFIESHLKCLVDFGRCRRAINLYFKIVSPRLGCGLGGLNWEKDVKPSVEKYFGDDDNFIIASL